MEVELMTNIAQIGCGYWGPNLLRNFSAQPDCRVKWVVDGDPKRRQYVEANFPKSRAAETLDTALTDAEVQAVVVATPAKTHFEMACKALQAGKHVFVEKPMAMAVAEVDELDRLAKAGGLTLMVGHTFLYNPAVHYLKAMLDRGDLGEVYYAYSQRLNLGVIRSDVNAMWNLAPHDVSILCHLFNAEPVSVSAQGTAYIQPGIEDVVFMQLNFPGKIRASVHVSWLDPNKVRRIVVVGSRKMVVYDDVADDKIIIYDKGIDREGGDKMVFDQVVPAKLVHRAGDVLMPKVPFQEPLKLEARHFLECIRDKKTPLTDAAHARRVVRVLESAGECLKRQAS
jgi:predicted dehydrogenase